MHSEQYDVSSTFISMSYQYFTTSDNTPEPEEQAEVTQVKKYDTQKAQMHQPATKQQSTVQNSVTYKQTEASHPR